jgi:hypothetical protein
MRHISELDVTKEELERRIREGVAAEFRHMLHDGDATERAFQLLVVQHPERLDDYDHSWTPGGAA